MKVLITGGLGYIGSHIASELSNENIEYVIVDNLSNSYPETKTNLEKLTGKPVKVYSSANPQTNHNEYTSCFGLIYTACTEQKNSKKNLFDFFKRAKKGDN